MLNYLGEKVKKVVAVVVLFSAIFLNIKGAGALSVIEVVLNSDDYNYLPSSAKELIRRNYEENGVIIPTEKNKQPGELYLNPEYVRYLELTGEEKAKVEIIPMVYSIGEVEEVETKSETKSEAKRGAKSATLDTTESLIEGIDKDEDLPATYDLRNVNGNNYVTPLGSQIPLGVCWAFAFNEQAEGYLMVTKNAPYNASTTQRFSVRQLDYAMSSDGFKDYTNPDGSHILTEGGNYYMASMMASNGLVLVDNSYMPFNSSTTKKEMADILNYGNSLYELNRGIMLPKSSLSSADFIKYAKSGIKRYGGAEIETGSPTGSCSSSVNGSRFIYDEPSCASDKDFGSHSMQIIGWNDNFEWSFCKNNSVHTAPVNGSCSSGTLMSGTGAWLVRNSWGNSYSYNYVAYASTRSNMQINFTANMTPMSERKWDNNYHKNHWVDTSGQSGYSDTLEVKRKVSGAEKLELVKFLPYSYNGTYLVTASDGTNTYTLYNGAVVWPGVFTIDVSDRNIVFDTDSFTVTVATTNSKLMVKSTVQVFTSNIDKTPRSSTADEEMSMEVIPRDSTLSFVIYTSTKNIPSKATPTYYLYEGNTNKSSYLTVTRNDVGANNINAYVNINSNIGAGEYTLRICYENNCNDSLIRIEGISTSGGSGTSADPYLITKEREFSAMRYYMDAYFRLGNDITLTADFAPIGNTETPFTGAFDGGNHTITNLNVDYNNDCAGFLGYVRGKKATYYAVQNIKFVNTNVKSSKNAGAVIGCLEVPANSTVKMQNVFVVGGSVESTNNNAGALIGTTEFNQLANNQSLQVQKVYTSADVSGLQSSGMFGNVSQYGGLVLTQAQNTGTITAKPNLSGTYTNYHNALIGHQNSNNATISNYVTAALVKKGTEYDKSINSMADTSSGAWTVSTVAGAERIPIINTVASSFIYSTIDSSISVYQGDAVSLTDHVTPTMDPARLSYSVTNNSANAITMVEEKTGDNSYPDDIEVVGLKAGEATVNVSTQYDGNARDVTVSVIGPVVASDGTLTEHDGGILTMQEGGISNIATKIVASDGSEIMLTHLDANQLQTDNDLVMTGDTLRVGLAGSHIYDYLLVVLGDVTGDGVVDSADYVKIKKHIMGTEELVTSSLWYMAADYDGNNAVTSMDYVKVRKYIMNRSNS